MRAKTIGVIIVVVFAVLIGASLVGSQLPSNQSSSTPNPKSSSSTNTTSSANITTLESIIAGAFPTGLDKQGTGGVIITVRNLYVEYVHTESDGDWHVAVTDGNVSVFITEITPAYQSALGMPTPGTVIDETGVPYCDTVHQTESWHGDTCWEIHPILSWRTSGSATNYTTTRIVQSLNVTTHFDQDPILRGSNQTITASVSDSDGPIPGVNVTIEVDYASGYTIRYFSCVTSTTGECDVSWTIGATADPGTFEVITTVDGQHFYSSFLVSS